MTWQRRSRTGRLPFPFAGWASFFGSRLDSASRGREPTSSTEQMATPYAFRKALQVERVSAVLITAPRNCKEVLVGLASPNAENPLQLRDVKTVVLKTYRSLAGSHSSEITVLSMPA